MNIPTAKRFTLDEYHRLIDLGFFQVGDRLELIRGEIIQMAAKGTPHTVCCTRLNRELLRLLGEQAILRCQDPIVLLWGSEPEPDFTIVEYRDDDYLSSHPTTEDIILVIEIADSSLSYDQDTKIPLYAEAGIKNYWLFNLQDNQLETYSNPYQKTTGSFSYRQKLIFLSNQMVKLPEFPETVLNLAKIFPIV